MAAPTDNFLHPPHLTTPMQNAYRINSSNTANVSYVTRAIYVGATGSLVVDMKGGDANVTFLAVPAGTVLPLRVIKVKAASTANSIIGLY